LATVAKKQLVFVFNYTDVNSNLFVKKEDIFYLDSVFKDSYNDKSNPSDFVIFKINDNQKIPNKYIGKLETSEEDFAKSKVYMAGYPYGLPLIVSLNAKIISKSYKDGYYRTDLDALNLNSGSPVFNQQKKIIGILHGNAGDFVPSDKSPNKQVFLVSNINNIDEGMLVLPINNIVKFLKNKK
jgi:V8-like Glu-specific endopeptidase